MITTYDVRIWKIGTYKGKRVTTYYVRWMVDGQRFKQPFRNSAQAKSFRAELVAASAKGEAFVAATGLPVSHQRAKTNLTWYEFACDYADMKWPNAAATTRRTHAEALTAVTMELFTDKRGMPDGRQLRSALTRRSFNTVRRNAASNAEHAAMTWAAAHSVKVATLAEPATLRTMLDGIARKLDGQPRASSVVLRWRKILHNAFEYAVERQILAMNPLPALKWRAPKTVPVVDRRVVANPVQARTLLRAVREQMPSGPRLVAFYGCIYFAGMRPEEAAGLTKRCLSLPGDGGWGEIHLEHAEPYAGPDWTDDGAQRERRGLKQRARGEIRTVPCPPELTELLNEHLQQFGTSDSGRLFTGERSRDALPAGTTMRLWSRARRAVFSDLVAASPLAGTPYDLRHAAVSTWLNAGVPATTVAEWAGHSVEVLLKIYAKCLDGESITMRNRVEQALGHQRNH